MKNFIVFLLIGLFAVSAAAPVSAGAATLSLSSGKSAYSVGDILKISVNLNSGGSQLQVVRAAFAYPADLMRFESFSLGSLFPQRSPGESTGNGQVSVGGFRAGEGTSANGLFGTASFRVLKAGSARIALTADSRMVTSEPKDIYSGGNSLSLTFGGKAAPEEKPASSKPEVKEIFIAPAISSASHPENSWSNNNTLIFNWTKPAGSSGYVLELSREQLSAIGDKVTTESNSYTYQNVPAGIWIFHLKAKYGSSFGPISYYTVKIDTQAPGAPQPTIEGLLDANGKNIFQIFFAATDDLSGIHSYQIQFDDNSFQAAASPYTLSPAEENAETVTVKAIDNAGNENTATLAIADYIGNLEAQPAKKALFDVQAATATPAQFIFYLALIAAVVILIVVVVAILIKKRKKT